MSLTLALNGTIYHERKKQENVFGYQWSTGEKTPTIKVNTQGKYGLTINEACRKKELNFIIKRKNCFCNVFVPNTFSPDGNGINDAIKPFGNAVMPLSADLISAYLIVGAIESFKRKT